MRRSVHQRLRASPVQGLLREASAGARAARLTRLDQADNAAERARWPRLLEVYVPLGGDGDQARDLRLQLAQLRAALADNERIRAELRSIAAGLGMPDIEGLDVDAIVRRAVRDGERRFGLRAQLEIGTRPRTAGIALKITLYRFIQECLNNVRRHAGPARATVLAHYRDGPLQVVVGDDGRGFAPEAGPGRGRLGLAFLEERVRLAGGRFAIRSTPGAGCTVEADFPVQDETDG